MSIISKIPRGLRVLPAMIILALLVWQFAYDETYYYYALGGAILLTALTIFLVYRRSGGTPLAEKAEKVRHILHSLRTIPDRYIIIWPWHLTTRCQCQHFRHFGGPPGLASSARMDSPPGLE